MKRPSTPHPWEYCNKCWTFGDHYSKLCPPGTAPKTRPTNLNTEVDMIKKANQIAYNSQKKQKKKKPNSTGETAGASAMG